MVAFKVDSVLPGVVISTFNAPSQPEVAPNVPRTVRRALVTESNTPVPLFIHALARGARTRMGARKSSKEGKKTDQAFVCVPHGPETIESNLARFVGSYATGPVGSHASRKRVCVPPDTRAWTGRSASTSRAFRF